MPPESPHKGTFSRALNTLKNDPVIDSTLKRRVQEMQSENRAEIRRYSKRELERMIGRPAPKEAIDEATRLWKHALRPYRAPEEPKPISSTAAEQHRRDRKSQSRNMKARRR